MTESNQKVMGSTETVPHSFAQSFVQWMCAECLLPAGRCPPRGGSAMMKAEQILSGGDSTEGRWMKKGKGEQPGLSGAQSASHSVSQIICAEEPLFKVPSLVDQCFWQIQLK